MWNTTEVKRRRQGVEVIVLRRVVDAPDDLLWRALVVSSGREQHVPIVLCRRCRERTSADAGDFVVAGYRRHADLAGVLGVFIECVRT